MYTALKDPEATKSDVQKRYQEPAANGKEEAKDVQKVPKINVQCCSPQRKLGFSLSLGNASPSARKRIGGFRPEDLNNLPREFLFQTSAPNSENNDLKPLKKS